MSSTSHIRKWSKASHGGKAGRNTGKTVKCCFQDTRGAPPGLVPLMCSFGCFKFIGFDVSFWATLVQSRAHQPLYVGSWYNHLEMWHGWCRTWLMLFSALSYLHDIACKSGSAIFGCTYFTKDKTMKVHVFVGTKAITKITATTIRRCTTPCCRGPPSVLQQVLQTQNL